MIASEIQDECPALDVTGLDRADLIQKVRELERQRSVWEMRVRACQEREALFLGMVNDMGQFTAESFTAIHMLLSEKNQEGMKLIDQMNAMAKNVEKV